MPSEIDRDLDSARTTGLDAICATAEQTAKLPPGVLLAVASRESNCKNVAGDGGHGRGVFQIDDRSFGEWLAAHGAGAHAALPPVRDAALFAAQLLKDNLDYGRRHGVRDADLLKFALSAYNAGAGGALAGYKDGDSDKRTTGNDYGADVLRRLDAVQRWLGNGSPVAATATASPTAGATPTETLRPGARGAAVTELKRLLRAWFGANPPPARKFAANPVYGPAAVEAVKELQRRAGLDVDGVVGPATWAALRALAPAAHVSAAAHASAGAHTSQVPSLPASIRFPNDLYPKLDTWNGLQPWIVPQVQAIAKHFGLRVTAGHGGHPPHAQRSDHAWGGACDLAGPQAAMVACNLWADGLCADPFRGGAVFRWVGGPAKDSSGVEPGHSDHVHLSWYRMGPATTIFGTPQFP